ncbi:MAG: hypothetical protein P8M07_05590 [Flavobacteriales bacterium]|nr:hypothetical protein [Flavobacteriales bacterium]
MKEILYLLLCFPIFCSGQTSVYNEPHEYGGWYCPDNLNGFPAVDINNWKNVPVVHGRMATKEETQNGTSLIFVDNEKYPDARPLDIAMPKLARFYNNHSRKEEIIIVIQAINISTDSVVGFRYLNGGNGSARLNEVKFLTDNEIADIVYSRFVSFNIKINATQDEIWSVLTKPEYNLSLQPIFDGENRLKSDWNESSEVNFKYPNGGVITSEFAGNLYGNNYIQIDCELAGYQYVEKFLLLENEEEKNTELQVVCGPYGHDFENQQDILNDWAQKVKELSEKR